MANDIMDMLRKQALDSLQEAIGGQQQKNGNGGGGSGKGILAGAALAAAAPMAKRGFDAYRSGQLDDASLAAHVLLENLTSKLTASLALLHLLDRHSIDPASIAYVLGCGEEAVGDRYQRGGGNMAKAVAGRSARTRPGRRAVPAGCSASWPGYRP